MEPMSENCDNCFNRHITSAATHWCPFCSEGLCFSCTEHHQASKISKSHSLVSISDYQKLPTYIRGIKNCCETHEEPFHLYCRTHEQCCCLSCVKETHNGCKGIETLNDVVSGVKSSPALEEIETSLKTIIGIYDNLRENRMENKSRLSEQREKIIAKVYNIRKSLNDHLDKLVNAIETTISAEFEAATLKIENILTEVEDRQKNICKLIEEEEALKQLSTDLQTFLGLPFFQSRIKEETEYFETLKKENKIDELDLTFESSELESFCEDNDSFGTVTVAHKVSLVDFDVGKKDMAQIILPKEVCNKHVSDIHKIYYDPERSRDEDEEPCISGCTILPSGQLLFVDNQNKTLVMRSGSSMKQDDYREIISLQGMYDVTVIDSTKAAVTVTNGRKVVIVDLLMGKEIKTFSLDGSCWGIEYRDGNLFIKSNKVFIMMDVESGDIVKRIKSNCTTCVAVSDENIFGCKHKEGIVYCFNEDGDIIWQLQDEQLKYPQDLTTDNEGFVYVIGKESNNAVVISPDGKTCKEILNKSHGLDVPRAIHFEKTLGLLLVCNEEDWAIICNIK